MKILVYESLEIYEDITYGSFHIRLTVHVTDLNKIIFSVLYQQ